jgi:hypothetical protein
METLTHYDRELFYAINHGLSHPLLDPVMWLITSSGAGLGAVGIVGGGVGVLGVASGGLFSRRGSCCCQALSRFWAAARLAQVIKRTVPRLRPSNLPDAHRLPPTSASSITRSHRGTRRQRSRWRFGCSC